jgi:hypothetical protein
MGDNVRLYWDCEFHENGQTIDLASIGIVRDDGAEYYAVAREFNFVRAWVDHTWLRENVLPHLPHHIPSGAMIPIFDVDHPDVKPRAQIADEIQVFAGDRPEWWGYYCSYDWVVLCFLYGSMVQLPGGWPMHPIDIKQEQVLHAPDWRFPDLPDRREHVAIDDARETKFRADALQAELELRSARGR